MKNVGKHVILYRRVRYMSHGVDIKVVAGVAAVAEINARGLGLCGVFEGNVVVWKEEDGGWEGVDEVLNGFYVGDVVGNLGDGGCKDVKKVLEDAVRVALMQGLGNKGWVRVGDRVVLPKCVAPSVALRFQVAFSKVDDVKLMCSVGVCKAWVRKLKEDEENVDVVVSPAGLTGSIEKSRLAGSSLEASVRKRWYECGLLSSPYASSVGLAPTGEVLFVQIDKDLNMPVPKECVLAIANSQSIQSRGRTNKSIKNSLDALNDKLEKAEWKPQANSRKRPRSPSPASTDNRQVQESRYWKHRNALNHVPTIPQSALESTEEWGLTADSINAALVAAEQRKQQELDAESSRTHPTLLETGKPQNLVPNQRVPPSVERIEPTRQKVALEPDFVPNNDFTALEDDITSFFDNLGPEMERDNSSSDEVMTNSMEIDTLDDDTPLSARLPVERREPKEVPIISAPSTPDLEVELQKYYEDSMQRKYSYPKWKSSLSSVPREKTIIRIEKLRASKALRSTLSHTLATRKYTPARRIKRYLSSKRKNHIMLSRIMVADSDSESDDETDMQKVMRSKRTQKLPERDHEEVKIEPCIIDSAKGDEVLQLNTHRADPAHDAAASVAVDCASASYILVVQNGSPNGLSSRIGTVTSSNASISSSLSIGGSEQQKGRQNSIPLHGVLQMMTIANMGDTHSDPFTSGNYQDYAGRLFSPASCSMMRQALCSLPRLLDEGGMYRDKLSLGGMRPVSLEAVYGSRSLSVLPGTRICVGSNGDWMETSPRALPTWEKSSLEPYSEAKDLQYLALVPHSCGADAMTFFKDLSVAYLDMAFGQHIPLTNDAISVIESTGAMEADPGLSSDVELSDPDHRMIYQYKLSAKALINRLCAILRSGKSTKTAQGGSSADPPGTQPIHAVIYIVSPFAASATKCKAALLRELSPQILSPSLMQSVAPAGILNKAPYRDLPTSTLPASSLSSITVRFLPKEICSISPLANGLGGFSAPLRPQLLKSAAMGTYNSVRTQRLRPAEPLPRMSHTGIIPSEILSPLTPDMAEGSVYHTQLQLQQLKSSASSPCKDNFPSLAESMIQELTCGWKYSPAFVLADRTTSNERTQMPVKLHLGYSWSNRSNRWVYTWCDDRGEMLDVSSICGTACRAGRRTAFSQIWDKARRWVSDSIEIESVTVAKLLHAAEDSNDRGFCEEELEDWHVVLQRTIVENKLRHWKSGLTTLPMKAAKEEPQLMDAADGEMPMMESIIEATTPAEEIVMNNNDVAESSPETPRQLSTTSLDPSYSGILCANSINIVSIHDDPSLVVFPQSVNQGSPSGFMVATQDGDALGCLLPAVCSDGEENVGQGFSMVLKGRYCAKGQVEKIPLTDIAGEFVKMKTLTGKPSWPRRKYQADLPIHLHCVSRLKDLVETVL